jgi:hypothetical protein
MGYLPAEEREVKKLPRAYVSNVIYSVIGDPFRIWVSQQIEARHQRLATKNDLLVSLDPTIAEIFRSSNSISGTFILSNSNTMGLFTHLFMYSFQG